MTSALSLSSVFLTICFFNSPRLTGHGGGLVTLKKHLSCIISVEKPLSFEVLLFKVNCDNPVCRIVIYRPPKPISAFLSDFSDFISSIVLSYDKIL